MNNILIRKAECSDLPQIEKLVIELIDSMDKTEGIDKNIVFENCQNISGDTNSHILLAEIDGVIIGFINFTIRKTLLHNGHSGIIDELVVTKNYRGKGVGKQLINAVIEKCKHLGCCEVEVSTEFTNTTARDFYKNCGFEEKGVIFEKDVKNHVSQYKKRRSELNKRRGD